MQNTSGNYDKRLALPAVLKTIELMGFALVYAFRSRAAYYLLPLTLYVVLTIAQWSRALANVTPDAVAYFQLARHWLEGNPELAISGYWGPLPGWIIAVAIPLFDDPIQAIPSINFIGGGTIVVGSLYLFSIQKLAKAYSFSAGIIIALFCARWFSEWITPDLLLGGMLCFGVAFTSLGMQRLNKAYAILGGLFSGLCFLAKPAGLPLGIGLLLVFFAIAWVSKTQNLSKLRQLIVWPFLGLTIVASLWITTLSLHYDKFTWTTSLSGNLAYGEWSPLPTWQEYHQPRAGRITSWEDPTEFSRSSARDSSVALAPPSTKGNQISEKLRYLFVHVLEATNHLKQFDLLGLLVVLPLLSIFIAIGTGFRDEESTWLWNIIPAILVIGLYVLSNTYPFRYFYPAFPFLAGLSFGFSHWWTHKVTFPTEKMPFIVPKKVTESALIIMLSLSVILPLAYPLKASVADKPDTTPFTLGKRVAAELDKRGVVGPTAELGDTRHVSLYVALYTQQPFMGMQRKFAALDRVVELGVRIIIVNEHHNDIPTIEGDPRFTRVPFFFNTADKSRWLKKFRIYSVSTPTSPTASAS